MAIAENVQVELATKVGIGELRARLKKLLDQGEPIWVRRHHTTVALLIPVKLKWWSGDEERRREISRVRKAVQELLSRLSS